MEQKRALNNILVHTINDLKKIFVYSLKNKSDIDTLLKELNYTNDEGIYKYEVTIYNQKVLPYDILVQFDKICDKLVVITNEPKLRFYLQDLNFVVRFEGKHKILYANKLANIKYIAIGGSAGSIDKISEIIKNLPPSNLSFFIIIHQKTHKSLLADIFQSITKYYKVVLASSDMEIKAGYIYVAPAGYQMIVAGGFLFLTDQEPKHYSKPSISTSFDSFSFAFHDQFLAILVCGYGKDGSDSLENIRKYNGIVMIEDPKECEATPILENAIETKQYDYILTINEINKLLFEKITHKINIIKYLPTFLDKIYNEYGYDYRDYHKKHIVRRIEHFYEILNLDSFIDFEYKILNDKELFKDLFLNISINVSAFFRSPNMYKQLQDEIPKRYKDTKSIKIWCAGCSTGEEPYSVAIMLDELGLLDKSLIYATDINDVILQYAKNGCFSKQTYDISFMQYKKIDTIEHLEKYMQIHNNFVSIKPNIKDKVLFFKHNLSTDSIINEFDIIFCRNVMIYFNPTLKDKVFDLFDKSLETNGLLILGENEALQDKIDMKTLNNNIYLKE